jgi:hypothetical protein
MKNCWAVGYDTNSSGDQTLIEQWNGTAWTVVPSPNVIGATANYLYSVSCVSADNCWAVGYSLTGPDVATLIEQWNGSTWSIVTSPNVTLSTGNYLYGVSCVSADECWAVGYSTLPNSSDRQTLIEQWNGSAWSIVPSPNVTGAITDALYGVTCVSGNNCWAVGTDYNGSDYKTLTEQWNGSAWTIVASPNVTGVAANVLNGVTCVSASDCWAAGYSSLTGGLDSQTLIEQWDGSEWTIVTSPNVTGTPTDALYGVTCVSASDCQAVGYSQGSHFQTLIEALSLPVQLTSVVSEFTHGSAGTFDIDLPLVGNPGIECRTGAISGDYTLVFTFANPLTDVASVSASATGVDQPPVRQA